MKMTLYFAPGACSMASHISLIEAKADAVFEKVDLRTHRTTSRNFYDVNPKGAVPFLSLASGQSLSENVAILTYIADSFPSANLIPPFGTVQHYQVIELLSYLSSEIHKQFGPYFQPHVTVEAKAQAERALGAKFKVIDEALRRNEYLCGTRASVADFYLFVMETWLEKFKHPSANLSSVQRHLALMRSRPSVKEMMKQEGLQ